MGVLSLLSGIETRESGIPKNRISIELFYPYLVELKQRNSAILFGLFNKFYPHLVELKHPFAQGFIKAKVTFYPHLVELKLRSFANFKSPSLRFIAT